MWVLREGPVRITKATIDAAWRRRAPGQRLVIGDAECRGLALVVNPTGMTWRYDFRPRGVDPVTGKRPASQSVTIGSPETHSPDQARHAAGGMKGLTKAGSDPAAQRRAKLLADREARSKLEEAAFTVAALIDLYAEKHVSTLRPATQRDVLSRLRLHLGPIADKPAAAISRREVATVVDRATKAGETTARRVRDYARAMWGWAQRRGTLPEGAPNPWESAPAPGRDVPRERVLSAGELGRIWRAAGTLPVPHGPMVRFLLLTLARREEVTAMTWGEVTPDLSVWVQPAARTKNRRAHVVHLSEPAQELLRAALAASGTGEPPVMPRADQLVFGLGDKPITTHSWVKRQLDLALVAKPDEGAGEGGEAAREPLPHWTLHDFRRAGVTWLASVGFAPHIADRLLNHVQGTIKGVAAVYQRGDFAEARARALDAWGAHVLASAKDPEPRIEVTDLATERARRRDGQGQAG